MTGHRKDFHGKCPECGSTRIQSEVEDWGMKRTYWCIDCKQGHSKATFERHYVKSLNAKILREVDKK